MNKSKSKGRDNKRAEAIKIIANDFSCTVQSVRRVINNPSYDYGKSDQIRKAFKAKYSELKKILA
jgi:hypothetical protein